MHDNSYLLFHKYAASYFTPGLRVLEIGAAGENSAYRQLVNCDSISWETLDIAPRDGITHVARSEYDYPLPDNAFDIVLSAQVLEHVRHPWRWIKEVSRIVKPGGHVITISPVSWPYHEAPVDCWRIYPEGIRALCEESTLTPLLVKSESLESALYWRTRPGKGRIAGSERSRLKYALRKTLSYFGYPVEVAYDTIMIARKDR